jgi:hypothetical protein
MGVKRVETVLIRVAWLFGNNKATTEMLLRSAELYAEAKRRARDNRDRWKMRKRLNQGKVL